MDPALPRLKAGVGRDDNRAGAAPHRCGVIESGAFGCFGWRGADFFCAAGGVSACTGGVAVPAAGAAASCGGAAGRSFAAGPARRAAGSSVMMLTGGIEAAEGS